MVRPKPRQLVRPKVRKINVKPRPGASVVKKPANNVKKGGVVTGDAGFQRARVENEQQQARFEAMKERPWRFRMKPSTEERIILLDKKPHFLYEHGLYTPGQKPKGDPFEQCLINTGEVCPLCQKLGKDGTWTMMLTCIHILKEPYKDKNGKVHKSQKRLLPVKGQMIQKYERLYNNHGKSFRGIVLTVFRDGGKKSNASGTDFEEVKVLDEATLAKYGDKAKPVNYDKAFPPVTAAQLRARYGVAAVPGSAADVEGELEEYDWEDADGSINDEE